jgi:hypothetical protein
MMIRNFEYLNRFEKEWIAQHKLPYEQALRLVESMWQEGVALGVLPPENPLEGIEVDFRIARILNSCSRNY